jgi:hypothetical protein
VRVEDAPELVGDFPDQTTPARGDGLGQQISCVLIERHLLIGLPIEKVFERLHDSAEIIADRLSEDLLAHAEILVDDKIPHGPHVRPGNTAATASKL